MGRGFFFWKGLANHKHRFGKEILCDFFFSITCKRLNRAYRINGVAAPVRWKLQNITSVVHDSICLTLFFFPISSTSQPTSLSSLPQAGSLNQVTLWKSSSWTASPESQWPQYVSIVNLDHNQTKHRYYHAVLLESSQKCKITTITIFYTFFHDL